MNKEATNNVIFRDGKAGKSKVENDLQKVPIINWIYKTKSLCFFISAAFTTMLKEYLDATF